MREFKLTLISKYRNALMGIGILDVLICHMANCYQLEGIYSQIFGTITRTVFTPGFLFLSGFGIYYSYSNNTNKKEFYKRRWARLVLPFWIMVTIIFLLRLFISGIGDFSYYIGMITTAYFWLPGKTFNYWYIAVILLFYLIYPFVHDFVFGKLENRSSKSIYFRVLFICCVLVLLNILLGEYYPYYNEIELAVPKFPMLFIGMFAGYLAKEQDAKINLYYWGGVIIIVLMLCYYLKIDNKYFEQYYYIVDKLLTIPIWVITFEYLQKRSSFFCRMLPILCWFGMYTLELYVIHIYLMRVVSDFHQLPLIAEWWISVPIALLVCMPMSKFNKIITRF